jgi:hypothetical protein
MKYSPRMMQMIRFLKKFNLKKLKYFDQLVINCNLASILQPSTLRPTHTGHLNPRRRCDGKHSLKVNSHSMLHACAAVKSLSSQEIHQMFALFLSIDFPVDKICFF